MSEFCIHQIEGNCNDIELWLIISRLNNGDLTVTFEEQHRHKVEMHITVDPEGKHIIHPPCRCLNEEYCRARVKG